MHAHSCLTLCDFMDCSLPGSFLHKVAPWTGMSCLFLLQGIFPTMDQAHEFYISCIAYEIFTTEPPGNMLPQFTLW